MSGMIDLPLEADPESLMRQQAGTPESSRARKAVTCYRVLTQTGPERILADDDGRQSETEERMAGAEADQRGLALLAVRILTGRTHQIRAHMACLGHPLAGDVLYGGQETREADRVMLHALKVRLRQPFSGQLIEVRAEQTMPELMRHLYQRYREDKAGTSFGK